MRDLVGAASADIGRPSIDPVVFFTLQFVLCFGGLRSECQVSRVAADRLNLRWYLGYDVSEPLPDHSRLTRIRERSGLDRFRRCFEVIVDWCVAAGRVWGDELSIAATNADLDSLQLRFAVGAHVTRLFGAERSGRTGDHEDEPERNPKAVAPTRLPVVLTEQSRITLADRAAIERERIRA